MIILPILVSFLSEKKKEKKRLSFFLLISLFLGGFATGLLIGLVVAPMRPSATRNIKIATWIVRAVALVILIVLFAISIREFYSAEDPSKVS